MKRNLLGIVAYPFVWWLVTSTVSLVQGRLGFFFIPPILGTFILLSSFILSSVVCGWIASSKPGLVAFLGSLLHHILLVVFTPFAMRILSVLSGPPPPELSFLLPLPEDLNDPMIMLTLRVILVIFFPIVAAISALGGFLGARLKKHLSYPS